jgi:hypothetical protein
MTQFINTLILLEENPIILPITVKGGAEVTL